MVTLTTIARHLQFSDPKAFALLELNVLKSRMEQSDARVAALRSDLENAEARAANDLAAHTEAAGRFNERFNAEEIRAAFADRHAGNGIALRHSERDTNFGGF